MMRQRKRLNMQRRNYSQDSFKVKKEEANNAICTEVL